MTWFVGLDLLDVGGLRHDIAIGLGDRGGVVTKPFDTQRGTDLARDGQRALVTPGLIDLQVNGGAGRLLGDCTDVAAIHAMAAAHWATGTAAILPTLISDSPSTTQRVIALVAQAQKTDPSLLGLHLEGPHLAVAGAHDPAMLRPLTDADLDLYAKARARLGRVMITLAPEIVPPDQIAALTRAWIIVALGHTACDHDQACAAYAAGAVMATHLYNAMSGLGHRAPGLVGATLDQGRPYGLIADGVHVHPAALRIALAASPDAAVLVSDAMALTGSAQDRFTLARQPVYRRNGRLERADGTLAGADLTLVAAIENLARWTGRTVSDLAPMAHAAPLGILGDGPHPTPSRFVVWHKGQATARIDGGGLLPLARV